MPRLPHTIDFNDLDYPELAHIFRSIDTGIAAIVASDPAMRPRTAQTRRARGNRPNATMARGDAGQRHAA